MESCSSLQNPELIVIINKIKIKSTDDLLNVLQSTSPQEFDTYLKDNAAELFTQDNPFADYMRHLFQVHNVQQQHVFMRAEFSQRYGYRLISGEKRTKQRDYILRLCYAAGFTLEETQRALQIYGLSRLYARIPRDAVLILAFQSGLTEIPRINELLTEHQMAILACRPGNE